MGHRGYDNINYKHCSSGEDKTTKFNFKNREMARSWSNSYFSLGEL
jgi:hypothetical protein